MVYLLPSARDPMPPRVFGAFFGAVTTITSGPLNFGTVATVLVTVPQLRGLACVLGMHTSR
jgi:hypothetical protein